MFLGALLVLIGIACQLVGVTLGLLDVLKRFEKDRVVLHGVSFLISAIWRKIVDLRERLPPYWRRDIDRLRPDDARKPIGMFAVGIFLLFTSVVIYGPIVLIEYTKCQPFVVEVSCALSGILFMITVFIIMVGSGWAGYRMAKFTWHESHNHSGATNVILRIVKVMIIGVAYFAIALFGTVFLSPLFLGVIIAQWSFASVVDMINHRQYQGRSIIEKFPDWVIMFGVGFVVIGLWVELIGAAIVLIHV